MVCLFRGFGNMPTFLELRPDYPLILTLQEHIYPWALTWFYIAGFTSARTIPFPLIRQTYPGPVGLCTGAGANFCSSSCAPSASESTWRLTPAHASLRDLQSHIDEQLMSPAKYHCATPGGSSEFDFRESAPSSLAKSAQSAIVAVTCCCAAFRNWNPNKGAFSVLPAIGCVPILGPSVQIRSN